MGRKGYWPRPLECCPEVEQLQSGRRQGVLGELLLAMEKVQAAFACQQNPSSTPAQVKDANVWLEQFQGTTEAWQVADQLLALEVAGNGLLTAAQIFAAQPMMILQWIFKLVLSGRLSELIRLQI